MFAATNKYLTRVPCPYYPKCFRLRCLFSHEASVIAERENQEKELNKKIADENAKIKKNLILKRERKEALSGPPPTSNVETPREESPLLKKAKLANAMIDQQPSAITSEIKNNNNMKLHGNISLKFSSSSTILNDRIQNNVIKSIPRPVASSNHSGIQNFNLRQPPLLLTKVTDKLPRQIRQKAIDLFFKEFSRIYEPVLPASPSLAHEHALSQELAIYSKAHKATYQAMAGHALKRLKERTAALDINDTGIDGVWVKRVEKVTSVLLTNDLKPLLMSEIELIDHGFPIETAIEKEPSSPPPTSRQCERCSTEFTPSYPLNPKQLGACRFHHGNIYTKKTFGGKERYYSCCHSLTDTLGCTTAPHVFKIEDLSELHRIHPFRKLPSSTEVPNYLPIVGIDCEMSYTTNGLELTRLTVVSADGERLFDEVCKPLAPIVDLNTRYSGITQDMIDKAKFTFDQLHEEMKKHLSEDTIIVGHGLDNDLKTLRLIHKKVIDTTALFPHPKKLPYRFSLRLLADKLLQKTIQKGTNGHDSYEDAKTALEILEKIVSSGS